MVDPPLGGESPSVRLALQALGQTWTPVLALAGDGRAQAMLTLPSPARFVRVRAMCAGPGEGLGRVDLARDRGGQLCADFVWLPDSVEHGTLRLQARQLDGIWTLDRLSDETWSPLWLQSALGAAFVLLIGLLALRRLARGG